MRMPIPAPFRLSSSWVERTLLVLTLGILAGVAAPAWGFAQRLARVEAELQAVSNAVMRIEDRLNRQELRR